MIENGSSQLSQTLTVVNNVSQDFYNAFVLSGVVSDVIPGLPTDAFSVNTKSNSVSDGVIKTDDVSDIWSTDPLYIVQEKSKCSIPLPTVTSNGVSVQNFLSAATMINSESCPTENQNLSQIDIHAEEIPNESTFEIVGDLPSELASNLPTMESVEALPNDFASTLKVSDAQNSVLTTPVSDNPQNSPVTLPALKSFK
ncbi:hypothetical protein FEM48_Zijuj01G0070600 [Ziziphus jujuba var. spinosa]|uniref:Uncharacterized protein n=1 Tax=Ziziphus jujuba var. spinosa TaxID=714518 RepID=A0A978VZT6_ZIZJJ|nr:hypothetical protein FEM48_Zijuj01G0070600 [Ziziphus jujuba var. spinosa]